jgi:hypothetical protein
MKTKMSAAVLGLGMLMSACAASAPSAEARRESYEARGARLAERDPIEAFRLWRRGAAERDAACAARLLAFADRKESTLSQREYARLFVEKLLAGGAADAAELHRKLALSWNFMDPRSPSKVREHLLGMARAGLTEEMASSAVLREMARATGAEIRWTAARRDDVRACDATPADASLRMEQRVAVAPRGPGASSVEMEVTAWGGGNDKLLQASGVLAFVTNAEGEPVFRGRHLWVRNGNERAVTVSVPGAGISNLEVKPGEETLLALAGPAISGIDLTVRYAWKR